MHIIEWMAWAVIVLAVIKTAVLFIKPRAWLRGVVRPFYTNPLFAWISVIAVFGGFYYLTRELSVVQIFASFFVVMFLMSLSLRPYARELMPAFEKILTDRRLLRKEWYILGVWAILIAWAVYYLIQY